MKSEWAGGPELLPRTRRWAGRRRTSDSGWFYPWWRGDPAAWEDCVRRSVWGGGVCEEEECVRRSICEEECMWGGVCVCEELCVCDECVCVWRVKVCCVVHGCVVRGHQGFPSLSILRPLRSSKQGNEMQVKVKQLLIYTKIVGQTLNLKRKN